MQYFGTSYLLLVLYETLVKSKKNNMQFFRHLATQVHVLSSKAENDLYKFKVHNSNHGFMSINTKMIKKNKCTTIYILKENLEQDIKNFLLVHNFKVPYSVQDINNSGSFVPFLT